MSVIKYSVSPVEAKGGNNLLIEAVIFICILRYDLSISVVS